MHSYLPTYIYAYIQDTITTIQTQDFSASRTFPRLSTLPQVHTYIRTYIHTYIHICIHAGNDHQDSDSGFLSFFHISETHPEQTYKYRGLVFACESHTHIHTCIHTYKYMHRGIVFACELHTYIHIHIHTHIHKCILIHIYASTKCICRNMHIHT
jgi:hypothetical protein